MWVSTGPINPKKKEHTIKSNIYDNVKIERSHYLSILSFFR